jgi:hypothetical protein
MPLEKYGEVARDEKVSLLKKQIISGTYDMKSLSVIFLVFSIRCQTFFKPLENNQTYI